MNIVVLIFPDTVSISDFIIARQVSNVVVNSGQLSLTAPLGKDDIFIACHSYGGRVKPHRVCEPHSEDRE